MFKNIISFVKHKPGITLGFLLSVASLLLGVFAAALPAIKYRLDLTVWGLGASLLLAPAGALTGVFLSSKLFSRMQVGKWLFAGPALQCLLYIVLVTSQYRIVFWAVLYVTGMIGFFNGVSINAVIDIIEKRYHKRIMASCHGMYSLGGFVSAGLAAGFYSIHITTGWQIAMVAICIVIALLVIRHHLFSYVELIHSGSSLATPPASILGLAFICFVCFMGEGSIADWSAIYLKESLHSTAAIASLGYAGFSIMMAIGRFNGDALIPKLGAKKMVIAGSLVAATGFVLVVFFHYRMAAIAGFTLAGLGYCCIVPILFSAAVNVKGVSPAVGLASIASGGLIGFLFGPSVIGMISEKVSMAAGLSFILILNLAASFVATRNKFLATDTNSSFIELA